MRGLPVVYWLQMLRPFCVLLVFTGVVRLAFAAEIPQITVAVDFSALSSADFQRLGAVALEKRAVVRLVQEGFAVVAPTTKPDIHIRIFAANRGFSLEARSTAGAQRREVRWDGEPLPELHLEVVQKVAELARKSRASLLENARAEAEKNRKPVAPPPVAPPPVLPRPEPVPAPPMTPPPKPTPPNPEPNPSSAWFHVDSSLGGGLIVREGGVDGLFRISGRLGLGEHWGLHFQAGLIPSTGAGIRVYEIPLLVGVGYRWILGSRWLLEPFVLWGIGIQTFSLDDPTALSRSGSRRDLTGAVGGFVGVQLLGPIGLGLRVEVGISERDRGHVFNGQTVWWRGAVRLELEPTLFWRLR